MKTGTGVAAKKEKKVFTWTRKKITMAVMAFVLILSIGIGSVVCIYFWRKNGETPSFAIDSKIKTASELFVGKPGDGTVKSLKSYSGDVASINAVNLSSNTAVAADNTEAEESLSDIYSGNKLLNENAQIIEIYKNGKPLEADLVAGLIIEQYLFLKYIDFRDSAIYYDDFGEKLRIRNEEYLLNPMYPHVDNLMTYRGNSRSFIIDMETGYILDLFQVEYEYWKYFEYFVDGDKLASIPIWPEQELVYREKDKSILLLYENGGFFNGGGFSSAYGKIKTNENGEIELTRCQVTFGDGIEEPYYKLRDQFSIRIGENGISASISLYTKEADSYRHANKYAFEFYSFDEERITQSSMFNRDDINNAYVDLPGEPMTLKKEITVEMQTVDAEFKMRLSININGETREYLGNADYVYVTKDYYSSYTYTYYVPNENTVFVAVRDWDESLKKWRFIRINLLDDGSLTSEVLYEFDGISEVQHKGSFLLLYRSPVRLGDSDAGTGTVIIDLSQENPKPRTIKYTQFISGLISPPPQYYIIEGDYAALVGSVSYRNELYLRVDILQIRGVNFSGGISNFYGKRKNYAIYKVEFDRNGEISFIKIKQKSNFSVTGIIEKI